jgi:hypothetical protein
MKTDIDRLVAQIAPEPGPGLTPGARELLTEITATARAHRRPRFLRARPRLTLSLAAGLAAAAVVLSWLLPGALGPRPAAALDIRREGSYYIVTVKDLFADPERYESQLRQLGLHITLRVAAASPSLVGTITYVDNKLQSIERPGACARRHGMPGGDRWCTIGLKIPVHYTRRTEVILGRAGRPGEVYWPLRAPIDEPGEPLHCVDYVNKTVAQVRVLLAARGLKMHAVSYWRGNPRTYDSWYVHDGVLEATETALMVANSTPDPHPRPRDTNCPKGS